MEISLDYGSQGLSSPKPGPFKLIWWFKLRRTKLTEWFVLEWWKWTQCFVGLRDNTPCVQQDYFKLWDGKWFSEVCLLIIWSVWGSRWNPFIVNILWFLLLLWCFSKTLLLLWCFSITCREIHVQSFRRLYFINLRGQEASRLCQSECDQC